MGLKVTIPKGGQFMPKSITGDNLLWKNPQKKEIKNKTSEVINKIIPQRRPVTTDKVCNPWKVPSRVISRHHWYTTIIKTKSDKRKRLKSYILNHLVIPDINVKPVNDPKIGQGL